jgi:hypothetical protein
MAKQKPVVDTAPLEEVEKAMPDQDQGADASGEDDEDDEDEDEDEDDEDEDEDDEGAEKGGIDEIDLLKALDEMDSLVKAQANGVSLRQTTLAAKLAKGEALTKSEKEELATLASDDDSLEKSTKETLVEDPKVEQGFEVSEFLDALGNKLGESLDANRIEIRKSFAELGEFNRAFARVLASQAGEIRALKAQLAKSETAPRSAPQAVAAKGISAVGRKVNDTMNKSEGGGASVLSRPQILDTMFDLFKSDKESGVDWTHAISMYESTGMVGKQAMLAVAKKRGIDPTRLGL